MSALPTLEIQCEPEMERNLVLCSWLGTHGIYPILYECTKTECPRIGTGNGSQEDRRIQMCLQEHDRGLRKASGREISRKRATTRFSDEDENGRQTLFLISKTEAIYSIPG